MKMIVKAYSDLNTPERILIGPGPSMVSSRVLRAMAHPLLGHLDPKFIELMKEVQELLRYTFQTQNEMTLPISGTGSAGMESTLANLLEYNIEISGGLGIFKGKAWRIGLMGHTSRRENVSLLLSALSRLLH